MAWLQAIQDHALLRQFPAALRVGKASYQQRTGLCLSSGIKRHPYNFEVILLDSFIALYSPLGCFFYFGSELGDFSVALGLFLLFR